MFGNAIIYQGAVTGAAETAAAAESVKNTVATGITLSQVAGTAETAAAAESVKNTVAAGITLPQVAAFGVGVVAGAALCYAGYRYHKFRTPDPESTPQQSGRKELKDLDELLAQQEHVSLLDAETLETWFSSNRVESGDAKLMIAIPSDKVLSAVGYSGSSADLSKYLIQSIYSSKTGAVHKLRLIGFDSIDSKLEAQLLENDGLVILNA